MVSVYLSFNLPIYPVGDVVLLQLPKVVRQSSIGPLFVHERGFVSVPSVLKSSTCGTDIGSGSLFAVHLGLVYNVAGQALILDGACRFIPAIARCCFLFTALLSLHYLSIMRLDHAHHIIHTTV